MWFDSYSLKLVGDLSTLTYWHRQGVCNAPMTVCHPWSHSWLTKLLLCNLQTLLIPSPIKFTWRKSKIRQFLKSKQTIQSEVPSELDSLDVKVDNEEIEGNEKYPSWLPWRFVCTVRSFRTFSRSWLLLFLFSKITASLVTVVQNP